MAKKNNQELTLVQLKIVLRSILKTKNKNLLGNR